MSDVAKSAHDAYRARYMNDGAGKPMFVEGFAAGYDASAARVAELEAALNERANAAAVDPWPGKTKTEWQAGYWAAMQDQAELARASTPGEGEKT